MRSYLTFIVFLNVAMSFGGCALTAASDQGFARYGRWQTYSLKEPLHYPDFDLLFIGKDAGSLYPGATGDLHRMGFIYRFSISSDNSSTTASWSSGTGDIGPTLFEIDGKRFFLEMVFSDYLKKSKSEDQVAIWSESEFHGKKNRWWFW
jgi:hypothetical protein